MVTDVTQNDDADDDVDIDSSSIVTDACISGSANQQKCGWWRS